MFGFLRKYWRLTQVASLMIGMRMALFFIKLPRMLAWLSRPTIPKQQNFELLQDANYYSFRYFNWFPVNPKGNCLPRSLILYWFARRCGYPVRFHCGIRWLGEALDGHAWLSLNETPFLEAKNPLTEEGYNITYSYPDLPITGFVPSFPVDTTTPFQPLISDRLHEPSRSSTDMKNCKEKV